MRLIDVAETILRQAGTSTRRLPRFAHDSAAEFPPFSARRHFSATPYMRIEVVVEDSTRIARAAMQPAE